MSAVVGYILFVALCWGTWPLVARLAGASSFTSTFVLGAAALVPPMLFTLRQGLERMESWKFGLTVVAGTIMGSGLIGFIRLTGIATVEMSSVVPAVYGGMCIVTFIGGTVFLAESASPSKIVGTLLVIAGITLLRPAG